MGARPGTRGVVQRRLAEEPSPPTPSSAPAPTRAIVVPPPPVPPVGDESVRALLERQRRWIRASSAPATAEASAAPPPDPVPSDGPDEGAKG